MKFFFSFLLLTFTVFVSGQYSKEPQLDHFTTDGYELTKYIKVSEIPYLMNKLTEFKKFHHTGYANYRKERITCKEDDIPGYILRKERYFDRDKMENIDDTRYYYNSKAIDIIYDYLSKFGYSYFDQKIIIDLEWNDKEVKESCAKTFQRNERKTCPNCNGKSRYIDNSDKYSTESRSVTQNCTSCDRTFRFRVWNWKSRGWKTPYEKKLGYVKCSGCIGYGFTETYHLGADPTTKKCHVSTCNNGWVECGKCYGKGQKRRTVYVEKKHETTQKNGCARCNNSGEVNTGKIKTYTCSSCDGKGYIFKRIRNPEWETIGKYYRENKKLYTKIFSKYNGTMRPDGFRVDSWKKWVWVEAVSGYAFLGNKKYLTLHKNATFSGPDGANTLNYNNLDFVQIAFQRNLKDSRQVPKTTSSVLTNKYDTNIQKTTSGTIHNYKNRISLRTQKNDTLFSDNTYLYENGKIKTKQPRIIKDSKQIAHGNWVWYSEDGQKTLERNYVMGEKRSVVNFFKNGQIKYSGNYRNSKKFGTWTWYFENGNKSVSGNYNSNGKEDSIWTWYSEGGQKTLERNYVMGEQKSLAEFFKNGQIKYSGNYRNGKKFGTWTWYFENGNKRVLGNYNFLGKQDGIWTWYFENGQKETSQDFGSGF